MEANLNITFHSARELDEFMRRYLGEPREPRVNVVTAGSGTTPLDAEIIAQAAAQDANAGAEQNQTTPPLQAQPARTRKPRSDAGQIRGPHKTTGDTPTPVPASEVAAAVTAVSPTQSTPLAPTPPFAAPPSAAATTAPAGAGLAVKLTEAHARAELKKISTEPGMGGTQAAIDYIKKFGVHQITKLPESMYEQFIAGVDKEIAAFRAKAPTAK